MTREYPTTGRILYEWTQNREYDATVVMAIDYRIYPVIPQTWNAPQEGGDCELIRFRPANHVFYHAMEERHVCAQFSDELEDNDALRLDIENDCRVDAQRRYEDQLDRSA